MALQLDGGINAKTRYLVVSGTVPPGIGPEYRFALDDEVLALQRFEGELALPDDAYHWRVRRGVGGTVPASHSNAAPLRAVAEAFAKSSDLTPPSPFVGSPDLTNLPTGDEKAALDAAASPSGKNPFATMAGLANLPTADQKAALGAAATPNARNPFATMADVGTPGSPTMLATATIGLTTYQATAPIDLAITPGSTFGGVLLSGVALVAVGGTVLHLIADGIVIPALGVPPALSDIYLDVEITDSTGANKAHVFASLASFSAAYAGGTFAPDFTGGSAPTITGTDLSVDAGVIKSGAGGLFFVSVNVFVTLG